MKNFIVGYRIFASISLILIISTYKTTFSDEEISSKFIISDETIEISPSQIPNDLNRKGNGHVDKFKIRNKKINLDKEIQLLFPLNELYGYFLYQPLPEIIGIKGSIRSGRTATDIIDIKEGKVLDHLYAAQASLSPHSRYLIYTTFFPPMILPEFKRSFLMVYDMVLAYDHKPIKNDINGFPPNAAGWPFYPVEYILTKEPPLKIPVEGILANIAWKQDESGIIFISWIEESEDYFLVDIDISQGVDAPVIKRKKLDVMALGKVNELIETMNTFADKNGLSRPKIDRDYKMLPIKKIEVIDRNTVKLDFYTSNPIPAFQKPMMLNLDGMEKVYP